MIASLPMYARAHNRAAHDLLWVGIRDGLRARGIAAPDGLDHHIDHMESWGRHDLVLGQICNLPLRSVFRGQVTVIGAADYGLSGCAPGFYRSVFVVHQDSIIRTPAEAANARFAFNEALSQSGYGAAQLWAQTHGFQFSDTLETGSHHNSINAVATRRADIAAIDVHSWTIESKINPQVAHLRIIGHTAATPGQTFITRSGENPRPYFEAIAAAVAKLPPQAATVLGLKGIVALPKTAYDLPFPPKAAPLIAQRAVKTELTQGQVA